MKRPPPQVLNDGDSIVFTDSLGYFYLGCCDCNLTHKVNAKITKDGMELQIYRDSRRTAQRRRRKREVGLQQET